MSVFIQNFLNKDLCRLKQLKHCYRVFLCRVRKQTLSIK